MTLTAKRMDEPIRLQVYEKFGAALNALKTGDRRGAYDLGEEAWALVPEPKYGWDTSYMCLLMMVKALRGAGKCDPAIELVNGYVTSPHYAPHESGPYFWLGTLYFEKGDFAQAHSYLDRANKMSRGRDFVDEDKRYRDFYFGQKKTKARH